MTATPGEIVEAFENVLNDRKCIYERWLAYSDKLLKMSLHGRLAEKYEASDIINTLFLKLYESKRKWDKEKYPAFEIFFFMIIKSHVSNLAKMEERLESTDNFDCDSEEEPTGLDMDNINFISRDEILSDKDAGELYMKSLDELKDDEDAAIVFMEAVEDKPNREMAEDLGVDIKFIEAAKKRVRRKLHNLFEEFFGIKIRYKS